MSIEVDKIHTKIEYKGKKIKYGRYLFNLCLPEDYPLIDEAVDQKKLKTILDDISLKYSPTIVMTTMNNIKDLGFENSTLQGYTIGIDDLYSEELLEIVQNMEDKGVEENTKFLTKDKRINSILKSLPIAVYIESGARGTWDQARQLVLARGHVADADNKPRNFFIRSNLVNGLNQREFFESCWGVRKGMLDTALSTGVSGYLTRQLIYSTSHIELDEDCDDCGTTDYINVDIKILNDKNEIDESKTDKLAKSLLWRYYLDENTNELTLITSNNYEFIKYKIIKLRSPIYCKNKKICKTCYGSLSKVLHSDQVGIIATQSVGERTTQLVLRTFHTSGVVQGLTSGKKNKDIIHGIGVVNRLFHSAANIDGLNTPEEFLLILGDVFSGSILSIHYEIIISAMMWAGKKQWRLHPNRNNINYEWISILKIPAKISWLVGTAFANVKSKLIEGVIDNTIDETSSLSKLFKY